MGEVFVTACGSLFILDAWNVPVRPCCVSEVEVARLTSASQSETMSCQVLLQDGKHNNF